MSTYCKDIIVRNINHLAITVRDAVGIEDDVNITVIITDDHVSQRGGEQREDESMINHVLAVFFHTSVKKVILTAPGIFRFANAGEYLAVTNIINAHLQGDRDLLLCQDELIDAGFGRWARL